LKAISNVIAKITNDIAVYLTLSEAKRLASAEIRKYIEEAVKQRLLSPPYIDIMDDIVEYIALKSIKEECTRRKIPFPKQLAEISDDSRS
jgi:hypothetical protein